jgi:putative nucleotidyltransferase with HDIG domain
MSPSASFRPYEAHRGKELYIEYTGEAGSRTIFHHDRAEVTYSPFFRRLAFRQYHIANRGPENRTRLLHSIEVATIASGMARRLGLNVDLIEAIALGHDIGKPPCGYPADRVLNEFLKDQGGFSHGALSSELLEWNSRKPQNGKRYEALALIQCYNEIKTSDGTKFVTTLSKEVVDGIKKHTPPPDDRYCDPPLTLEGQLVRIADNFSYISQEIDEGLCLDDGLRKTLQSYLSEPVLKDEVSGNEETKEVLKRKVPGCRDTTNFLDDIFGLRLGPRLMAMINRIEKFNRAELEDNRLNFVNTRMCKKAKIPILKYDPAMEFIDNFLWHNFIGGKINQHAKVKERAQQNEENIKKILELRLTKEPEEETEKKNFEEIRKMVEYYYPDLNKEASYRRAVAYHVATLTDTQVYKTLGL